MNTQPNFPLVCALKEFSRWNGKLVALAGVAVLLGWQFGSERLKSVLPGFVAMNPLTAICFIAAGVSLVCFWAREHRDLSFVLHTGQVLACLTAGVGVLKLADYFLGSQFGLDQILFRNALEVGGHSNRIAPNTAFNFLLSGLALFALNSRGRPTWLIQNLSLVVMFNALLAILGYVYGANYLYGIGQFIPMAIHTATLFFVLSIGLISTQTDYGVVALMVSSTPGGVIARRLLPIAFGVPATLAALRLWGKNRGLYDSEFGVTLMVLASIATFIALIWWNAVLLNRADRLRVEAEAELQKAHDDLELRVQERTSELVLLNQALRTQMAERERAEQQIREQAEEKRKLEEQFLRSQRMESIGALAGGIAHDLNNALAPILMGSQLLQMNGHCEADREKYLELIRGSAQRCSQMVRQILTFARGAQNQAGPVQLRHLISEMAKIVTDTFPKPISIHSHAPKDLWPVQGDTTELHQVLMNLCVNARDAMPDGGMLTLRAGNMVLDSEAANREGVAPGPHVVLSVADTGTGIPPEVLPRIFEPFFTTKAPDRGTGLGLSTVLGIAKRHNGFVEVQSTVGKGTEFRVYLPAVEFVQQSEANYEAGSMPSGRGELILMIDDEASVRELAKTTLESHNYRVLTASNGLEAIACFEARKGEIKLVITDNDMPFMNGVRAIQAIQRIDPHVRVVMASGTKGDTEQLQRLDTTRLSTLSKPYDVKQLLDSVSKALSE
jgi:signal transduction histidine kinase/CheY-like chemotaxis protein